jgi:hypothetical protein
MLMAGFLLLSNVFACHDAQAGVAVRSMTSVCGWEQLDWSEMSGNEQQLWSRLGWTQVSWDSDNAKSPASESKDWDELSSAEKGAASQLGFNEANWETACK